MVAAPPEVITGRLMSGAGSAPMAAAAGAYASAAVAYEVAIERLQAHMASLSGAWQSPASVKVALAVQRYLVALRLQQTQLVTAATRTELQAAAFATAYATMAQMPHIVENRVTTSTLIATNFLGMNTIPIGVKEGEYVAMTLQDIAVQETYLASSVANTTFEPFMVGPPIALGLPPLPPNIGQAVQGAESAAADVRRATDKVQMTLHMAKMSFGKLAGLGYQTALNGQAGAQQEQAQDAVDRFREQTQGQDQLGQQLMQIPQQVAGAAQSAAQLPQQALQPLQQVGQQFGSQLGSLMQNISPENMVQDPGFFDTQATSPTLEQMGSGGSVGLAASALRVPGLAGLSGPSTGFRFPGGWDSLAPVAPPAAPPPPAAPAAAGRMGSPMAPLHALARRSEDEQTTPEQRELSPLWGVQEPEPETVSAGSLVNGRDGDQRQEAATPP